MSESNLKNLKNKRKQLKASLTRFNKHFESCSSASDTTELKKRLAVVEQYLSQFENIQCQIELLEDESDAQSQEREEFENYYFQTISKVEQFLNDKLNTVDNKSHTGNIQQFENNVINNVRLPTIKLPTFSGAYDEWFPFHDTFLSLIHTSNNLTEIQKFHYLKSSLQGEAAEVISSLEITSENYQDAWEMLKERYSNKRLIIQKHVRAIFELPVAHKQNSSILRQIVDCVLKHLRALKTLQRATDSWDDLLMHLISTKIDHITNKEWENSITKSEIPSFKQMIEFLSHKCDTLEIISIKSSYCQVNQKQSTLSHVVSQKQACILCKANHLIYNCQNFLNLSIEKRLQEAKRNNLCINCLRHGHQQSKCTSGPCKNCGKRHNTLLHFPVKENLKSKESALNSGESSNTIISAHVSDGIGQILLPTAIVNIFDYRNKPLQCRILLDSGSQSNFITSELARKLNLKLNSISIPVVGINKIKSQISHCVNVDISSTYNSFRTHIKCLVLENIAENIPQESMEKSKFSIPKNIKLADPTFYISNKVDLLIGAEIFWSLLCVGQIKTTVNQPYLHKTHLGWIVSGHLIDNAQKIASTLCNLSIQEKLDSSLTRFWELEECPRATRLTVDERVCETHFNNSFKRNEYGRFVVKLPLKTTATILGESRQNAIKRLYSLEKKLIRQPQLKVEYDKFMQEYLDLKHMARVPKDDVNSEEPSYYLPHHAVIKADSITTKLRVVFDGSCKSSNGTSLNDILMVGPTLQEDLFSIVLRFRTYQYVITADIAKMYRQILVDESNRKLQRIVWRFNPNDPIEDYELLTVTYGTASAPYLAVKAMQQLATEEAERYPTGSSIILRDFYVDDLLTGANTINEAKTIISEITSILPKGGFELRKWSSNCKQLLKIVPNITSDAVALDISKEDIKTLGLQWKPTLDVLQYRITISESSGKTTKRTMLSKISQLFDPLGLVSPVIITAKIMIQKLWLLKLSWDESVPTEIHSAWSHFRKQLKYLETISVPRQVTTNTNVDYFEICGFCDASEKAYGACIYIRSVSLDGVIDSKLLCSKSRIAPAKSISLPRLELCGAVLLSQLLERVRSSIDISIKKIRLWTDSTIVLFWIRSTSRKWKTFVSNRVSEVQTLTKAENWNHVRTSDNPADLISRGINPEQLATCKLWWHGPDWLSREDEFFPTRFIIHIDELNQDHLELRNEPCVQTFINYNDIDLFARYSDLNKLIRIVAYCIRFKQNIISKVKGLNSEISRDALTTQELSYANIILVKLVQEETFVTELEHLRKNQPLHNKSKLLCLNPFLDKDGVIRVGGRIQNSHLSYDRRHQIILPANHIFTKMIIECEHRRQLHAGIQQTIASLRAKYWPLAARGTVRHTIRKCMSCFKAQPRAEEYIMGNLPPKRVEPSRPFLNSGVDYCGPFHIRDGTRRNSRIIKAYASIFICLSTKAVHIEVVSNLSSEAFLSALKRFIARRGYPANLYSDNGTNFVGSNKELQRLYNLFYEPEREKIFNTLSQQNIQWHFIPARSPHFGGLWESAIKSAKYHLQRIAGNAHLSFEELYTLFTQIEAVLNSRPITPMSDDPNDPTFLTPGHFLIGNSLTDIVEPYLTTLPLNRLSRWQHVQRLKQHFWMRWSKEYLNQLQERKKWHKHHKSSLQIGKLVIIKEDGVSPHRWISGRILDVHPGTDGVIRAATIQTSTGVTKRAANKLCVLPIETNLV